MLFVGLPAKGAKRKQTAFMILAFGRVFVSSLTYLRMHYGEEKFSPRERSSNFIRD